MNTNKLIFIAFILLVLILPVNTEARAPFMVRENCRCTMQEGTLRCTTNNCTSAILTRNMQASCGTTGTLSDITFECQGVSGSDPYNACHNFTGSRSTMNVRAAALCTPDPDAVIGSDFCARTDQTWRFIGYLLLFVRILIPLAIVAMGTFDMYQAIIADKSDDLKKHGINLGKRMFAGVMIFLIPTILNISFTLIANWSEVAEQYEQCATCLLTPGQCEHRSPVPGRD